MCYGIRKRWVCCGKEELDCPSECNLAGLGIKHTMYAPVRRIQRCCEECAARLREEAKKMQRDIQRAKALLEYLRGERTDPRTDREVKKEEHRIDVAFLASQRLHSFRNAEQAFASRLPRFLTERARTSRYPHYLAGPAMFEECVRRQAEIDATGRGITPEDRRFHADFITLNIEEAGDDEILPDTFLSWTLAQASASQEDEELSAEEALRRDIRGYEIYLADRRFGPKVLHNFLHRSCGNRHTDVNWKFQPARDIEGAMPPSVQDWVKDEMDVDWSDSKLNQVAQWIASLDAYSTHILTEYSQGRLEEFLGSRDLLSLDDRRELNYLEAQCDNTVTIPTIEEMVSVGFANATGRLIAFHEWCINAEVQRVDIYPLPVSKTITCDALEYHLKYLKIRSDRGSRVVNFVETWTQARTLFAEYFDFKPQSAPDLLSPQLLTFKEWLSEHFPLLQEWYDTQWKEIYPTYEGYLRKVKISDQELRRFREEREEWARSDRRVFNGLDRYPDPELDLPTPEQESRCEHVVEILRECSAGEIPSEEEFRALLRAPEGSESAESDYTDSHEESEEREIEGEDRSSSDDEDSSECEGDSGNEESSDDDEENQQAMRQRQELNRRRREWGRRARHANAEDIESEIDIVIDVRLRRL